MLRHEPRWLIQRTPELMSKSRELCEQARRASEHSNRLKGGLPSRPPVANDSAQNGGSRLFPFWDCTNPCQLTGLLA